MSRNWIFLGDSLTEGVGSKRISHVSELAKQLRSQNNGSVHEFRLRQIESHSLHRDIDFNVAGYLNGTSSRNGNGAHHSSSGLWLWNLACEGQTIETDFAWLPLIGALRPELVVIFRGSLESILRPVTLRNGEWPWWVPRSWRGYAAMDPRCYFSTTWWRKAKQTSVDALKQKARLKLLQTGEAQPLMDPDLLITHQASLLKELRALGTRVLVLGLLPVAEERFPGSPEYFRAVNARLQQVAVAEGAEFFDWAAELTRKGRHKDLFYRDSFHPNAAGARALAEILQTHLASSG